MSTPQLVPRVRRVGPQLLVGGAPLRVLRLTAAGGAALDALLTGMPHPGVPALRARLLAAGMLLLPPGAARLDEVTVVVPVRGPLRSVRRVLAGVPESVGVVVVDDGCEPPLELPGVTLVRHARSRGPAAARNAGAAEVRTSLVAFVDADVSMPPGSLERLTGHFADERVVAAAPRVTSDPATGLVGVLEEQLCALDQGPVPAEVQRGSAVSYLPSAVLLVRISVLQEVGGFDEQLHVGEDVDLVWRLGARGSVRYDPEVVVRHAPRIRLGAALRRRYDYGTSAGALDRRHPGRLRHVQVSPSSVLPWAAALLHPAAGVAAVVGLLVVAPGRLPVLPTAQARRVAAAGQWVSFGAVGRYAVRPAWPLTAALMLSPRVRRLGPVLAVAYAAGSCSRLRRGPVQDLPARVLLQVLEDVAYSTGVWGSALEERRWRVLLPGLVGVRRR